MSKLSDTLKAMATKAGACGKVMDKWMDPTDDSMVRLFVEQSNFCLSEDVPPVGFIRSHFSKELLHEHNVYLDEDVDGLEAHGKVILLGNCTGDILVMPYDVVDIQIASGCDVSVLCGLSACAHIGMFGKSKVKVDATSELAKAYVHRYSDGSRVSSIGDVKERRVMLER